MKERIKYTPQGFSYIDVTLEECINWGGYGVCNGCGQIHDRLKLIWVLTDTYCEKCFNEWLKRSENMDKEDIDHDLALQKDNDIKWYEYHGVI